MARPAADKVRQLIERGLGHYGRGELREAMANWRQALALDAGNDEVRSLMEFARQKTEGNAGHPLASRAVTPPTMAAFEDDWNAGTDTDPESQQVTQQVQMDDLPGGEQTNGTGRVRRPTVESPIPQLLAQITADGQWAPPAEREDAAPEAPLSDEDTRRLGSDSHLSQGFEPGIEDPSGRADARRRAAELVDDCRRALEAGDIEAASAAAEQALREGDLAPSPGIAEVIEPARPLFERVFDAYVGPTQGIPIYAMSASALASQELDHRAGFLLSRIDGLMTIEHLLDIASMSRFEAMRILAALLRVKAIKLL